MKKILLSFCFVLSILRLEAQDAPPKWNANLTLGHYSTSLITPSFNPIRLGIKGGITYQWNNNRKHRLLQSADLAYFNHRYLQRAIQFYSETSYQIHLKNGFQIHPFSIGGGYILSIPDMTSVQWNTTTQQYEELSFFVRNNWLITLGAGLGYETKLKVLERPLSIHAAYRIQIQGVMMKNNVPFTVYTPITLGVSLPISKVSITE